MKAKPIPYSQAELREMFDYYPLTGELVRLVGARRYRGGARRKAYVGVSIGNVTYPAHRVIWTLAYGPIPPGMLIDHSDGDPQNNRLSNLRVCTQLENTRNQRPHKGSRSPYKGVLRPSEGVRWQAYIRAHGKRLHLGCFDSAREAAWAYDIAAKEFHGEFARTNASLGLL